MNQGCHDITRSFCGWFIFTKYEVGHVCLQEATKPENRAQRPWIITMGHRPMYCSNADNDDCTKTGSMVSIN